MFICHLQQSLLKCLVSSEVAADMCLADLHLWAFVLSVLLRLPQGTQTNIIKVDDKHIRCLSSTFLAIGNSLNMNFGTIAATETYLKNEIAKH